MHEGVLELAQSHYGWPSWDWHPGKPTPNVMLQPGTLSPCLHGLWLSSDLVVGRDSEPAGAVGIKAPLDLGHPSGPFGPHQQEE